MIQFVSQVARPSVERAWSQVAVVGVISDHRYLETDRSALALLVRQRLAHAVDPLADDWWLLELAVPAGDPP